MAEKNGNAKAPAVQRAPTTAADMNARCVAQAKQAADQRAKEAAAKK